MEKPITIVRAEFIDDMANLINESTLPPFIIEPILKDLYFEIKSASQKQYEYDKEQYEMSLMMADHSKVDDSSMTDDGEGNIVVETK